MRKIRVICCCAAAALATPALAEDWQRVTQTQAMSVYIDMDSLQRTGSRVRFSQQWRHSNVRTLSTGIAWDTDNFVTEADCNEKSYVMLETVARLRGQVVLSYRGTNQLRAPPGTIIDVVIDAACAARPQAGTSK